jgi:hypothetical protein
MKNGHWSMKKRLCGSGKIENDADTDTVGLSIWLILKPGQVES